jgi:hypothetical protein
VTSPLRSCHDFPASVDRVDDGGLLARLDRIDALDRSGATNGELLDELHGLLLAAERLSREDAARLTGEEVVERRARRELGT